MKFGQPAMRYGIGYRYRACGRLVEIIGLPRRRTC